MKSYVRVWVQNTTYSIKPLHTAGGCQQESESCDRHCPAAGSLLPESLARTQVHV